MALEKRASGVTRGFRSSHFRRGLVGSDDWTFWLRCLPGQLRPSRLTISLLALEAPDLDSGAFSDAEMCAGANSRVGSGKHLTVWCVDSWREHSELVR